MVQDVRSLTTEVVFDLHSEAGVVAALAAVRNSTLSREAKSELRDLIFAYTKEGDASLEATIQQSLSTLTPAPVTNTSVSTAEISHEPVPVTPPSVAAPRYGFPQSRPVPVFGSVQVEPQKAPATPDQLPSVAAVLPVASPVPPPIEPVTAIVPEPPAEELLSTADMVPKAIVDEKLAAVAPVPEATVELRPPYQEDQTLDVYRARISEIKQYINQKVGNPVNLVDLDNSVGRSYMSALLEAMKAVSGGGGDPVSLMAKLEAVVKEVDVVLKTKLAAVPPSEVPVVAPVPVAVTPAVESTVTEPVSAPAAPVVVPEKAPVSVKVPIRPVIAPVVPVTEPELESMPVAKTEVTPMDIAVSRFKNVIPVTAQEPLKTPQDLPTAAEVKARSGITDPLLDPDVDLGLEQLLSEWTLFRKSGVFGTGPKGIQHPLYQKLASLQMPLILSGRFEGSTAEIRQSITDYMNGWRYEQGIIYEQDETFEHYLRRVIRHIIDSQTRRRAA